MIGLCYILRKSVLQNEQAIYIAAEGGCFVDMFYNGEPILVDSETHIPLSDSNIAKVNQALSK